MDTAAQPIDHVRNTVVGDTALWEALQVANIPVLLVMLTHATGESQWLEPPYAPSRTRGVDDNDSGGLPPDRQEEVRRAAFELLRREDFESPAPPSADQVAAMMSVCMGEVVTPEYGLLMLEEMGMASRQPEWPSEPSPPAETGLPVLIIGAGVSGICAAIGLRRAGIPFLVVERSAAAGGTWYENRYPGCGVDTPSHLYSYSFAPWNGTRYFAKQPEIHSYLEQCIDKFGVRDSIRFETEVLEAEFIEAANRWTVTVRFADGRTEHVQAQAVISAVGQLNEPAVPDIHGIDRFRGPIMHSARWSKDVDVTGKRVVVIGSGASAMQIVPTIADQAGHVTVIQRSPQWAVPASNYKRDVPEGVRLLMASYPLYAAWYRARLVWSYSDKIHESLQIDPEWSDNALSINAINAGHRRSFTRHITNQLGDRQDLLPKVLPQYPPFAKRMLIDNDWFSTMTRDNVELVEGRVVEIDENGVVDDSGTGHQADVVVFATGFQTLQMISSYEVRGVGGQTLRSVWGEDDARAYLGLTVPGFPNFFCLYGPNTGLGHGGSLIFLTECATRYIIALLEQMIVDNIDAVDVKESVFEDYNKAVDTTHEKMIWTHPGATNWYRNSKGRVVTNSPWRLVDFWKMTHDPVLADFTLRRTDQSGADRD